MVNYPTDFRLFAEYLIYASGARKSLPYAYNSIWVGNRHVEKINAYLSDNPKL